MHYADRLAVPFVLFLGEDEIRENALSLKDMQTGNQVKCTISEAIVEIRKKIAESEKQTPVHM